MTEIKLLLCTDLDRTLIPNGEQPESTGASELFNRLVRQPNVTLIFVTGRHRELVEEAIDTYHLPQPDYVIADVGSTIYQIKSGDWSSWTRWEQELGRSWGRNTHADIQSMFGNLGVLQLQEPEKQGRYKLSYYVSVPDEPKELEQEMYARLDAGSVKAALVWSVDETTSTGLLDVLPITANKYYAIEFLMEALGFDLGNTIFAGDSGNDLAVLVSPIKSVLVANATDQVRQQALEDAKAGGQLDALYLAHGYFYGMNGNYSAGILEGIMHYMPQADALLRR
jgi:sucrose-6F-phosphate phosphohydrolase